MRGDGLPRSSGQADGMDTQPRPAEPIPLRRPPTGSDPDGPTDTAPVTVCLLAGFSLRVCGASVSLSVNAQRLLTLMALQEGPVARLFVAGTLWPESTEERAGANLRSALWRLRRPGVALLESVGSALRLPDGVTVDLRRAIRCGRRLLDPADPWCPTMAEVVRLGLTKDVLPDTYEEWATVEREAFRQLRFHALDALCRRLAAQRRYADAVEAGVRAVECEPLRETAHMALISVHLAEGNAPEALRQYDRYRALVGQRLGLEPSSQMKQVVHNLYDARGVANRVTSVANGHGAEL